MTAEALSRPRHPGHRGAGGTGGHGCGGVAVLRHAAARRARSRAARRNRASRPTGRSRAIAAARPAASCWRAASTPDNVREAIAPCGPWGVDVSSGVERAPGVKDHGALRAFFAAVATVRAAEQGRRLRLQPMTSTRRCGAGVRSPGSRRARLLRGVRRTVRPRDAGRAAADARGGVSRGPARCRVRRANSPRCCATTWAGPRR